MPKKEHTSLPTNYPVCEHNSCPMAATCLHHIAYSILMEQNAEFLRLINPTRCSKDEACAYYRDKKPVIFARGFTNFQKRMYPQQYDQFMTTLILHFGRNQYFKRRRGDILLLPEEQEVIRLMLKKVGADSKMDFDKYEEHINWSA
ncbi:MAG: hypothetical protein KH188_02340 [Prevotella sp.]|nr:hypothetical protein [Prevotella sp.]